MTFLIAFAVQISASYQSQIEVLENTHSAALFHLLLFYLFFWLSLKNHFLRCILYVTACYSILQVFFYRVIKQSVTFFCFDASFSQLTKSVFCVTE